MTRDDVPTPSAATDETVREDAGRCAICGWPYAARREDGCVPGDCSYRPAARSDEWRRIHLRRAEHSAPTPAAPVGMTEGDAQPTDWKVEERLDGEAVRAPYLVPERTARLFEGLTPSDGYEYVVTPLYAAPSLTLTEDVREAIRAAIGDTLAKVPELDARDDFGWIVDATSGAVVKALGWTRVDDGQIAGIIAGTLPHEQRDQVLGGLLTSPDDAEVAINTAAALVEMDREDA